MARARRTRPCRTEINREVTAVRKGVFPERRQPCAQWYGLSVDIEERKQAEDRLSRSEAYLAEAQRLTHIGVAAFNETAILYGSEEIYRIWGFDPAQGVPSREAVFQRIHPDDRDRLDAEVQRALGEKRGNSIGYRIVLSDGTMKHLNGIVIRTVFTGHYPPLCQC
jgi:PAS domain-containing protein